MKNKTRRLYQKSIVAVTIAMTSLALAQCSPNNSPNSNSSNKYSNANASGTIVVRASAQELGAQGFAFPPDSNSGDPYFADGWQVTFSRILVTFNNIVISENPNINPSDQSQTGPVVATKNGGWAVDLQKQGDQPDANSTGTAFSITTISSKDNGGSFNTSSSYGFGFDIVSAFAGATGINFDAATDTDYQTMLDNQYTVLYIGTATQVGTSCVVPSGGEAAISSLPTTVNFRFGFKTPVTYANCQNPSGQASPVMDEDYPRGLTFSSNGPAVAQMTLHVDHPFWAANEEAGGGALRFDPIAAVALNQNTPAGETPLVTLEAIANDPVSFDYTYFSVSSPSGSVPLPYRTCPPASIPGGNYVSYDSKGAQLKGANGQVSFATFMSALQSTQGHMNGEGLCSTPSLSSLF